MSKIDYIVNNILSMHDEPDSYDKKDILDLLFELGEYARDNNRTVGREIKDCVMELRLDSNSCPICGEEGLVSKDEVIDVDDIYGSPNSIYESYRFCPSCQWRERDSI
jgi:hypothetical protein